MLKKVTIQISEDERNAIQRADVETSAAQGVIATILTHNLPMNTERFLEYEAKYQQSFYNFEQLKSAMQKKYVDDNPDLGGRPMSWNLDYRNGILTVDVDA